jgi:hypothetical protein
MEETPQSQFGNWVSIINAVRTPLSFFTLVLLVAQGILIYLARKAEGVDFRILLIAFIVLTFLLVIIVAILQYRSSTQREYRLTTDKKVTEYKYDVFLSIPMASLKDKEYTEHRQFALSVVNHLKEHCQMKSIVYAGESIDAKYKFDPHDIAVLDDLDAITKSKFFVLVYPRRVASSVLFEAGIALALGKECRYFVKSRNHLPFLLKQAEQAFVNVKMYEYANLEDIKKVLQNKKCFALK